MNAKSLPPLHDYQQTCVDFGLSRPAAGFFLDPGLGKTRTILEIFKTLQKESVVDTLVVVAKLSICYSVWPSEAAKWGMPYKIDLLHGDTKESKLLLYKNPGMIIINYDGLSWLDSMLKRYSKHMDLGRMMLVLDESTKVKNTNTQRFRIMRRLCPQFDRRYILTGTPCPNTLIDLYGQVFMLDAGKSLGTKTSFKNRYFDPCGFKGYDLEPIDDAEKMIFDKVKNLIIRFDSTLLDLPKEVMIDRTISLNKKTIEVYRDLEKDFIHILTSRKVLDAVVIETAATLVMKLRQLVSGAIYKDTKSKEVLVFGDDKIQELINLVEELNGKPCIVAYEFHHERDRILDALPKELKRRTAVFESKKAKELERDFNKGKIRILLGQTSKIAHGLNMQEAKGAAVIFFANNYNLEDYLQLIRRVLRQGNEDKQVFVYRIVAAGTIDNAILSAIERKFTTQKDFLNLIKQSFKEDIDMSKLSSASKTVAATKPSPARLKKAAKRKASGTPTPKNVKKVAAPKAAPKKAAPKKAAPKKAAPKAAAKKKAPTRCDVLKGILSRAKGCSVEEAAKKMDVTESNIRGLIGDLRYIHSIPVKSLGNGVFKI